MWHKFCYESVSRVCVYLVSTKLCCFALTLLAIYGINWCTLLTFLASMFCTNL